MTSNPTPTPVLLVDDHELIRAGLATAFSLDPSTEVVDQAGSVAQALQLFAQHRPKVVVTDLQLPDGTGLDIVRAVRKEAPETGLVVLTMHSGDEQIFAAMEAGASAFVGKDAPSTEVVKAAKHAAVSPRTFLCAGLSARDDPPDERGDLATVGPGAGGAGPARGRPGGRRRSPAGST